MCVKVYIRILLAIVLIIGLAGCWKDKLELFLNADGSGSVKQEVVWSERFVIAASEEKVPTKTLPLTEQALRKKIGSALDLTSIKFTDLPDGSRKVRLEGTFQSAEQFFLSDYCREICKLRLLTAGSGEVTIVCDLKSNSQGESIKKVSGLYGFAKGLYIKRTIHLPVEVRRTDGMLVLEDKKCVSWEFDLRNRDGLKRAQEFVEGKSKGKGTAVIPASGLSFSVPLITQETTPGTADSPSESDLQIAVSSLTWNKVSVLEEDDMIRRSELKIGLSLKWPENKPPLGYYEPVISHMTDDQGNDLVITRNVARWRRKIHSHRTKQQLQAKAKSPALDATSLINLAGYVRIVTGIKTEKVILDDIHQLVGKESTGNKILDGLQFRLKSIKGNSFEVSIDGGHNTISTIEMIKTDGTRLKTSGRGGWEDNYSYETKEPLSDVGRCELEVIVAETTVDLPFRAIKLDLP